MKQYGAIGLMSGTSLDGVDAAFIQSDGENSVETGPHLTIPYPDDFRQKLKSCLGSDARSPLIDDIESQLTEFHIEAVQQLLGKTDQAVDVIGFHGQTLFHAPDDHFTWQIGDAQKLADHFGIDVVHDFRSNDVSQGGQGAPLVPLYHRAIAAELAKPVAIINIGGVANVTWLGDGEEDILAFDTGPGNAPLDDFISHHSPNKYDKDGQISAAGQVNQKLVEQFLEHSFFKKLPPKSLDRDAFDYEFAKGMNLNDGAATLVAIIAETICAARQHMKQPPQQWLVTGGGRHNPSIMHKLQDLLTVPVQSIEHIGLDGDALEAQAFAYLAIRHLRMLPLTLPTTTGVGAPVTGGKLCVAEG